MGTRSVSTQPACRPVLSIRLLQEYRCNRRACWPSSELSNAVRILDRPNPNWISRLRLLAGEDIASRGTHLPRAGAIDHNARLAVDLARAPTSFVRP
jgi:hypothetical protein